jgi:hypothetical protein
MYEYSKHPMGQEAPPVAPAQPVALTISTPVGPKRRVGMRVMGPSGLEHSCNCYEDLPRDMVAAMVRPWATEFSTGLFGKKYECVCDPMWSTCPQDMRPVPASPDYAAKKQACNAFIADAKAKLPVAHLDIENEGFRLTVAQNIGRAFGLPESQVKKLRPAEFLTVVEERSRRSSGIWIVSALTVAAGGGYLLWSYLRGRKGKQR